MKIYLDDKLIKSKNVDKIKANFPNLIFTNQVEDSYDAEVIIVFPEYVTEENISKYHNLQWIQLYTAGFNTINLDYIQKRKIKLTNAKGVYSKTIAEDVVAKILAINRNIRIYYDNMKEGVWKPEKSEFELIGTTIGIIGTGSIGIEIAKRLKAFETKIIGYRRSQEIEPYFDEIYTEEEGLNTLLRISDYIILALPLNEKTYHLIDMKKFKMMKRTSVLINIARGEIINQDDLIEALDLQLIRGAALDVTTPEPLPKDNRLWKFSNVLITPHNAVSSPLMTERLVSLIIKNIANFVNNQEVINHVQK